VAGRVVRLHDRLRSLGPLIGPALIMAQEGTTRFEQELLEVFVEVVAELRAESTGGGEDG
jgi:hypothetical protein